MEDASRDGQDSGYDVLALQGSNRVNGKMKKVLFIIEHVNANGAERSLISLLKRIDARKYDVDLLLLQEYGDSIHEIPDSVHVSLYSLRDAFGPFFRIMKRALVKRDWFSLFFRIIYMFASRFGWHYLRLSRFLFPDLMADYDAVIAYRHSLCTDFAAYVFRGKKKIGWWHHGLAPESAREIARISAAYRHMTSIVAVSESSAEIVKQTFPNTSEKIQIIPNIIDLEEIIEKANGSSPYELNPGRHVIVSVGRFDQEKNMVFCVEVGKTLANQGIHFIWYMIGNGAQFEAIQKQIVCCDLEDHFVLTGRQQNPYPYIKHADVFFHPSKYESQGIAILESMALGTPVVVVRSSGPEEYILPGENGIIVEENAQEAAHRIRQLCENKSFADFLQGNARSAVEKFNGKSVARLFDKLLETELY